MSEVPALHSRFILGMRTDPTSDGPVFKPRAPLGREWARVDLEYIRRRSLWLDLTILWKTIGAVLSRRGAY